MADQLYRKTMKGKRTIYEPVPMESAKLDEGMTAGEIVTAVGTLSVLAINGYNQMIPPKTCTSNRIKAVEEAVLKLFKDTGTHIDKAITVHVCSVWNQTMQQLSGEFPT